MGANNMAYRKTVASLVAAAALLGTSSASYAATEISWWFAHGGHLGEVVNQIGENYNASQDACQITPVFKGTYEETLTSGIAAFRAGEQPNILQVFDAGAATIIGAKGAVVPAQDILENAGVEFNSEDYIEGVRNFYADSEGKMIGMPFNSSTPILYVQRRSSRKSRCRSSEDLGRVPGNRTEAERSWLRTPLAQSHLPWIFTENFKSRHNLQFATNNNGFDGAEGTQAGVR
jgi:sn-glycerol 3-phosphate transport system substrate-binding protein